MWSKKFISKLHKWQQQGLFIRFLPKYFPSLNPIEILWQFIKYQWLPGLPFIRYF
ncbi:MAG: transposase [Thiomargarita sp.]|nr:transposase [Thiomargarita sp.]